MTNLQELAGDAKVIDVTVAHKAEANGETIQNLSETGLLRDGLVIVAIERGGDVLMPNGKTSIQEGELITVLLQQGEARELVEVFTGPTHGTEAEDRYPMKHEV